jgi:CubicO group peptidase (beta-lactamase class C family)
VPVVWVKYILSGKYDLAEGPNCLFVKLKEQIKFKGDEDMKNWSFKTYIGLVSCLWILVIPVHSQDNSLRDNPELTSTMNMIESWLNEHIDYHKIPGMSVGIVYGQDLVYVKSFGYSDLENRTPATPETIYRIASITKTFTATAIMQLRDRGKLELNDPISKHLDWFEIKNRFPGAPDITIWHLLTHTSGLPQEAAFPYWTDYVFPTREEMIDALPGQETVYPPEHKFKYSNLALSLAGEIVTAVSGQPYEQFIKENILKPLEMKSTSVLITENEMKWLATPYSRLFSDGSRKIMPFTDTKGITPAGNMASTVSDLAKYISFQFRVDSSDTNTILKGSTLREMQRIQWLAKDWTWGWGLGFEISRWNGKTLVGHSGRVAGNRTIIAFVPTDKIGVVVLINADDARPNFFAKEILKQVTPVILKSVKPKVDEPEPDTTWLKYTGSYTDSLFYYVTEIMILNNKLVAYVHYSPPEDHPEDNIVDLTPESNHTFRMTGENGNGELVVFELDANNHVVRVKFGENYRYPADIE